MAVALPNLERRHGEASFRSGRLHVLLRHRQRHLALSPLLGHAGGGAARPPEAAFLMRVPIGANWRKRDSAPMGLAESPERGSAQPASESYK
jgi:hypothetical protein